MWNRFERPTKAHVWRSRPPWASLVRTWRALEGRDLEPGNVDQIALVDVLATAQPRAAHAAAIKNMGEAALDHFAALAHGLLADPRFQSAAVAIDRRPRLVVAMPTQITLGGL